MADRLTQLQDTINQQADHFCNSIGVLQQFSTPSKFPGFDRVGNSQANPTQEDNAALFATLIARCAKDIDTLIDSLPSEESSQELQVASLIRLEQENQESSEQLEMIVRHGEALLQRVQAALQDIAQSQLDMQNPTSNYGNSNFRAESSGPTCLGPSLPTVSRPTSIPHQIPESSSPSLINQ